MVHTVLSASLAAEGDALGVVDVRRGLRKASRVSN